MTRRAPIFLALAIVAISILPQTASAAVTRYVAPGGADSGDCSNSGSPCATIVYALSQAVNGDTVALAAGTYTGEQTTPGDGRGIVIPASLDVSIAGAGAGMSVIQAAATRWTAGHRVITNLGTLTLTGVTIQHGDSLTLYAVSGYYGGGLLASGPTIIRDSVFRENRVSCSAPVSNFCGAIGGGLFMANGSLELTRTTFDANLASCVQGAGTSCSAGGGAAYTGGNFGAQAAVITDSTFTANLATSVCTSGFCGSNGGALYARSAVTFVSPVATNLTFDDNRTSCTGPGCAAAGGAIQRLGGRSLFAFITMAGNGSACTGSSCTATGASVHLSTGETFFHGTVFAAPIGGLGHCSAGTGTMTAIDSLATDGACSGATITTDVALNLGALTANAPGTTATRALGDPSTARSAASCSVTNPTTLVVTAVTTDQRGVGRPSGAGCDAGAYEADETPPVVTATVIDQSTGLPYVSGTPTGGPVIVTFVCTDSVNVAPAANTYPAPITQSTTGIVALDPMWACSDHASNVASPPPGFPVSVVIISDGGPPDTFLGQVPAPITNDTTPSFSFFAIDTAPSGGLGTFVCTLTPGGSVPCPDVGPNGAVTLGPLAPGHYRFAVAARDLASNTDPTPAVYDFLVDPVRPVVTATLIDRATGLPYVPGTPARGPVDVVFGCVDPAGGSGIPAGRHNDTDPSARGNTYPASVGISSSSLLPLDPRWRCVDAAANAALPPGGFPLSIVIDRRAPTCTITLSRTSVPRNGAPTLVTATVSGTDANGVASRSIVSIVSAPEPGGPALPDASPGTWTLKGAPGKTFTFTGRVTDLAGNTKDCRARVVSR